MAGPEDAARQRIDAALEAAGWRVQDAEQANLWAAAGVAIREFPLRQGYGEADYLLFAEGQAVGVVEAKKEGTPLTGVEVQSARYGEGLPERYPAPVRPLPFLYESTGVETRFTNRLDPEPRSRPVFAFHKPETVLEWVSSPGLMRGIAEGRPADGEAGRREGATAESGGAGGVAVAGRGRWGQIGTVAAAPPGVQNPGLTQISRLKPAARAQCRVR